MSSWPASRTCAPTMPSFWINFSLPKETFKWTPLTSNYLTTLLFFRCAAELALPMIWNWDKDLKYVLMLLTKLSLRATTSTTSPFSSLLHLLPLFRRRTHTWRSFVFDRVWDEDSTQADVFADIEPLALSVVGTFHSLHLFREQLTPPSRWL